MNRDELAIEVRSVAGEGLTMTAAESVVDRLLPLIEADVRERIARRFESMVPTSATNSVLGWGGTRIVAISPQKAAGIAREATQ